MSEKNVALPWLKGQHAYLVADRSWVKITVQRRTVLAEAFRWLLQSLEDNFGLMP
jgi:hypothetical protein